ncbi:MAG: hypothetical protein Q9201_004120 [Fulgogasparrea decipioides]
MNDFNPQPPPSRSRDEEEFMRYYTPLLTQQAHLKHHLATLYVQSRRLRAAHYNIPESDITNEMLDARPDNHQPPSLTALGAEDEETSGSDEKDFDMAKKNDVRLIRAMREGIKSLEVEIAFIERENDELRRQALMGEKSSGGRVEIVDLVGNDEYEVEERAKGKGKERVNSLGIYEGKEKFRGSSMDVEVDDMPELVRVPKHDLGLQKGKEKARGSSMDVEVDDLPEFVGLQEPDLNTNGKKSDAEFTDIDAYGDEVVDVAKASQQDAGTQLHRNKEAGPHEHVLGTEGGRVSPNAADSGAELD